MNCCLQVKGLPEAVLMNTAVLLRLVVWPSWSKALDLSYLDSQWAQVRASSNLAATKCILLFLDYRFQ